ncbi:MAG: alanine--glyoxylate aminotransferase family protein [Actinobacteria bacterium]|nr:alanine--glyoxylate aminotransferase family protein [Actinomycetota bacterium]
MTQTPEFGRFFLPGPTEVHPDVLEAQARPMIGHRGQAIEDLLGRIQEGLEPVFQTTRPVIVSTSSATGLMEAAVRNAVPPGGKTLSLVNGSFSERFSEIVEMCGRTADVWEVPWGGVHPPGELADRLQRGEYDAVTLSQSETSTGALQDLQAIASVVADDPSALLLVDSVTGIGGVKTMTDEWAIDFILTGSQKALALPPGLAFGVASHAMLDRGRSIADRGWYFDLDQLHDQIQERQTPATPAVSLLYALHYQLSRIAEEGIEGRWARHLAMQERTFHWIDEMGGNGVDLGVLAAEGHRSPTVTCVTIPGGGSPAVVKEMSSRGWVIGDGYGKLKNSTFRIGHMGDHTVEELDELLDELSEVLG